MLDPIMPKSNGPELVVKSPQIMEATASGQSVPAYRLFDSTSVGIAAFLGSPLAGAALVAWNYRRMGKGKNAIFAVALGVVVTALAIGFGSFIPPFASTAVAIGLVVATMNAAKSVQGAAIEQHVRQGGKLGPRWVAGGMALGLLAVVFGGVVLVVMARGDGGKVIVGTKDEIYYSDSATKEDASKLGEALKSVGFFSDKGASVLFSKSTSETVVSFVVKDGMWDRPETVAGFEEIGRVIAPSVGGFPLHVRLVDSSRTTRKELTVGKLIIGTKDEIYYLGSAVESDARALGQFLRSDGFFLDHGASVFLAKDDGGTTISFVVREGTWDNPEQVASIEDMVHRSPGVAGGPPIKLRLLNSRLETKKEITVS